MHGTNRRASPVNGDRANGNADTQQETKEETMSDTVSLSHYSAALDEIYRLRRALQYEARVVEAHYEDFKTFPKTRRTIAEDQVKRMRTAAGGRAEDAYKDQSYRSLESAAKTAMPNGFSRASWESRGD